MPTFTERLDDDGPGPRLAVKAVVDVAGVVTTAACPALAASRPPAETDASCVATARSGGARVVGITNMHELAFGTTGVNPWFGTPANPLDGRLVPGGSSSGSAVAVATGEADVAIGTDTGGSIRIPAACCGVVGLKTTWGRIPVEGVTPLAPSLDTVGPLAATVAEVVAAMALLEPGFAAGDAPARVGRLRGLHADPAIDLAVDRALGAAPVEVVDVRLGGWEEARAAHATVLLAEAWQQHGRLLDAERPLGDDVADRLRRGGAVAAADLDAARQAAQRWRDELLAVLRRVRVIALPALLRVPPTLEAVAGRSVSLNAATAPVNLAGLPALAQPVPAGGLPVPAGLQLVGPPGGEEQLCALGLLVEAAIRR